MSPQARTGTGGRLVILRSTLSLQSLNPDLAVSVAASLTAIAITTIALVIIDSLLVVDHLVIGYLLPAALISVYFGSTCGFLASFASGFAAAYFLFPPKFSLYIADPVHIAELGFFMLLALTASKAAAVVAHDVRAKNPI
jgi:K+-sensing histidine kinase KdpD